jgi:RHO1 GDP-GTP exchange protein 1/2
MIWIRIFELIKGEMVYIKDLENIMNVWVNSPPSITTLIFALDLLEFIPLRDADPPIMTSEKLNQFCVEIFHNYDELYTYHKKLIDKLHEIQREQHPHIDSITAAL